MPPERDVAAFEVRATRYERGCLGRLHQDIVDRTVDLALLTHPNPRQVLDVGCGTGYLLRTLASRCPGVEQLDGIDPAPSMVEVATSSGVDDRMRFTAGTAEHLPYPGGTFDLVVSTTSFDHWVDQQGGLSECARVLQPDGHLVLVDQFSLWLAPTLLMGRRGKARTKRRASRLLHTAGFKEVMWHGLYSVIIRAATARA